MSIIVTGAAGFIGSNLVQALNARGKYQCFTQADMSRLRQAGYRQPMLDVEQGVTRYCGWLLEQEAGGWLPEVGQAA